MAADEILGIGGQLDISDIQASLNKLCDGLSRVGVDTDALSQRMTKALNEIAKSDGDLSTKTQQVMQTLKSAMDDTAKGIQQVPGLIDTANKKVETIDGSIGKLNEELAKTDKKSTAFGSITKQIDAQKQSLQLAKEDVTELTNSYTKVKTSFSEINDVYQALSTSSAVVTFANSALSTSNVATAATAGIATAATTAEAAANMANANATMQNAEAKNKNLQATQLLSSALQEYMSYAANYQQIAELESESAGNLSADIKMFERSFKEAMNALYSFDFSGSIEKANRSINREKKHIEEYKAIIDSLSKEGRTEAITYYEKEIKKSQEQIDLLQEKISNWETTQSRLNENVKEYANLLEAAKKIQNGMSVTRAFDATQSVKIDTDASSVSELSSMLKENAQKLKDLEAEADKFNGKKLGAKQVAELNVLRAEIEKTKNDITLIREAIRAKNEETFIGRLRNSLQDFKGKISSLAKETKDTVSESIDTVKEKIKNSSIGQRFGSEFVQAKALMSDFKNDVVSAMTRNGKFQRQINDIGEAFGGLGIPIGGALKSIRSVTKALWAMCTTPIGAVIAAVALAFKAVHTWMTKSAEGQKVYTKLMAYLGSLAKSITDIIVILGEYLYNCFTKPNGPLRDFGINFVKTFKTAVTAVINLLGGLGTTIKGVLTLNWSTFVSGIKKTWDGLKGSVSTIIGTFKTGFTGAIGVIKTAYDAITGDVGEKVGNIFDGMFTKAKEAAVLAGKIQEAEMAISKDKERQEKLEAKIAETKNKIYTLQGKEKLAAIEEAKALVKEKYDAQIRQQQKLVELHKQNASLHTQSLESIAAERELRLQVLRTQIQQTSEQKMLTRQQEATKRAIETEKKSEEKKEEKKKEKEEKDAANASKANAKKNAAQKKAISAADAKYNDVISANADARIKAAQELEDEVTDARLKAMVDGAEKIIAERNRETAQEVARIREKQEAAVKAEINMQKAEFKAEQAAIKARGGKTKEWNEEKHLDVKPIQEIIKKYTFIQQKVIEKANNESAKEELAKWDDYVEKYGSIQQRIYAITEEYKRKIDALRGSGDEIGASAAENEMRDKIEGLQMQQAKDSIDWDSVFQDLESHSTQYLEKLREQLKKLLSSGTLKIDDMKVVSDQINNVDDAINKQKASWGIVNESVRKHKRLVEEAEQAQLMLNEAQKEQARAGLSNTSKKIDIQTMLASMGIDATLDSITYKDKDKYFSQVADPRKHEMLKKAFDELGVTEVRLAKSTDELTKAQQKAEAAKDKAKKTPKQMAEDFASGIQGVLDKIQDLPNLLSSIGLGNSGFAKSVGHGIEAMSSAKNAATDFATGNYIGAAYNSISAIQSFGKMFGIGSGNYAEVAKRTKELTDSNQRLQYSIEQLKSSIDKSSGMRAVSNYQEAYKAQEAVNSQTMDILRTQMGYHGAHHSNAYYWNLSAQDYAAINKTLAQQSAIKGGYTGATVNNVGSLEDIYKLTPEQMNDIRTYNQDVWKNMLEQGEYNKSEYWEKYTELAGKLEELTEQINQNLTQTSFDSMKNDFISSLTDMNKSAQDFADNFTAMLNKSMLNFAVGKLMDEKLKPLYEKWASKMKENGGRQLTPEEIDDMRKEYQDIVNKGMKERDTIAAVTGYAEAQSRQTATTKAITAITADQASTLTGIGYAMQSALEHGNDTRTQMAVDISIMRGYAETVAMNMSEMRDIQFEGLGQLQQIVKNTAPIILIREDIAGMFKLMKDRY